MYTVSEASRGIGETEAVFSRIIGAGVSIELRSTDPLSMTFRGL